MVGGCVGPSEGDGVGYCVLFGDPVVGAPVVGIGVRGGGGGILVTGDGIGVADIGMFGGKKTVG